MHAMNPYLLGSIISAVLFTVLCLLKPHAGRIVLGIYYIVMGLGINLILGFTNPEAYIDLGKDSLLPLYRNLFLGPVTTHPSLFVIPIALFQIVTGVFILGKGNYVRVGLAGTALFVTAITPLGVQQFPWLAVVAVQLYLMTKTFDTTFPGIIVDRLIRRKYP